MHRCTRLFNDWFNMQHLKTPESECEEVCLCSSHSTCQKKKLLCMLDILQQLKYTNTFFLLLSFPTFVMNWAFWTMNLLYKCSCTYNIYTTQILKGLVVYFILRWSAVTHCISTVLSNSYRYQKPLEQMIDKGMRFISDTSQNQTID